MMLHFNSRIETKLLKRHQQTASALQFLHVSAYGTTTAMERLPRDPNSAKCIGYGANFSCWIIALAGEFATVHDSKSDLLGEQKCQPQTTTINSPDQKPSSVLTDPRRLTVNLEVKSVGT
jgi:hypothetical protein